MRCAPFGRLGLATFSPSLRYGENVAYAGNVLRNILPICPNDLLYGASMRLGKTSIDSHQLFDFAQNTFLFSLCILLLRLCLFILRIVRFQQHVVFYSWSVSIFQYFNDFTIHYFRFVVQLYVKDFAL
jgi:hypothetical protein